MFAREVVEDLRAARAADPHFPRVLFCHLGSLDAGNAFFHARWPEAAAIADAEGRLFDAFALPRGRPGQLFGPRVMLRGLAAWRKGHGVGRPVGDPLRLPGFFLIRHDRVVWEHRSAHAGDHPDLDRIAAEAQLAPRRAKAG